MQLSECRIGELVTHTLSSWLLKPMVGHIVGLDENLYGECTLKIMWQDGTERTIHPANIEKLK